MKTIKIDIKRVEIDRELSKITSYTGAKGVPKPNLEDFDRIATVDEDASLLDRYWTNAYNVLAEHLREFLESTEADSEEMSFTLLLSSAYDDSLTQSVKEELFAFVAATMTKSWFDITYPDKSAEWEAESMRLLAGISRKLFHRRKPTRKATLSQS